MLKDSSGSSWGSATLSAGEIELAQALAHQAMLAIQLNEFAEQSRRAPSWQNAIEWLETFHDTLAQGFYRRDWCNWRRPRMQSRAAGVRKRMSICSRPAIGAEAFERSAQVSPRAAAASSATSELLGGAKKGSLKTQLLEPRFTPLSNFGETARTSLSFGRRILCTSDKKL